jgi:hypothetical protein
MADKATSINDFIKNINIAISEVLLVKSEKVCLNIISIVNNARKEKV